MDTYKGKFPLHQAAADGDLSALCRCLIDASLHVDTRNRRGNTALMLAAETVQVEAVRTLLAGGANPLLYNTQRHTALDFCEKHSARRGTPHTASEVEIQKLLLEAESTAKAQGREAAGPSVVPEPEQASDTSVITCRNGALNPIADDSMRRCPVCGVVVRRRLKIDFLQQEDEKGALGLGECSLHVTTALYSKALQTMRGHPKLHYHNLLDMRSLRKEISESWGALASTRSLLAELDLNPADVRSTDSSTLAWSHLQHHVNWRTQG